MSEALVALGAALIGASAGLLGAYVQGRQQRGLDELRLAEQRRIDRRERERLAVADLAGSLSRLLQLMNWFTWEAEHRPARVTPEWVDRYDEEMKALLPVAMGHIAAVAALSAPIFRAFDPLVSDAIDLDARIGVAASGVPDDPEVARRAIGEFKDPAFALFRRFRDELAHVMGREDATT